MNIIILEPKSVLLVSTVHLSSANISTFPVAISDSLCSFNFLFSAVPYAQTAAHQLRWQAFLPKLLIPQVWVPVWLLQSLGNWLHIISTINT